MSPATVGTLAPQPLAVNANLHEIEGLLRTSGGLVLRRAHPALADSLSYLARRGRLTTLLPGVYVERDLAEEPLTRMRAVAAWDRDAVLTGAAAARLTFWPELAVDPVEAAVRSRRSPQSGFGFTLRRLPPELITTRLGLRCTVPALTALDLCPSQGADAIDAALRSRTTSLAALHEALQLTGNRRGNEQRRRLLLDSRDEPWSWAERQAHHLFRAEGITGWVANHPLPLLGVIYYLDMAFPKLKLALEIDGWTYHSSPSAFEHDRWRQNDLVLAGWRVLRFTPLMLRETPQVVVAVVRRAVR